MLEVLFAARKIGNWRLPNASTGLKGECCKPYKSLSMLELVQRILAEDLQIRHVMMICVFFMFMEVHQEFALCSLTVKVHFYLEVLSCLQKHVWSKHPELWQSGEWFFCHNNSPAETALWVNCYLASQKLLLICLFLYSSDLAPCDFFLFPRTNTNLK